MYWVLKVLNRQNEYLAVLLWS